MSHQRLQSIETDAADCRTRRERVAEIMKVKIVYPGPAKGRFRSRFWMNPPLGAVNTNAL
jgi:hypothetical protein